MNSSTDRGVSNTTRAHQIRANSKPNFDEGPHSFAITYDSKNMLPTAALRYFAGLDLIQ